jgi:HSP20 family protein
MIYRPFFGAPTWRVRTPFSELENMRRQMDRLMNFVSGDAPEGTGAGVFPLINLTEDRDNYYIRAELPGVKGEQLDIQAERNTVSLSGERKIASEGESVRYHRREREAGRFSRMVALPGEIDPDRVEAKLGDGILTLAVPKAETAKPKQITVK